MCLQSHQSNWNSKELTPKLLDATSDEYLVKLGSVARDGKELTGSKAKDAGSALSVQHFVHALAICGFLLPLLVVRCARITPANLSKRKNNQAFADWIREPTEAEAVSVTASAKAISVNVREKVNRWLRSLVEYFSTLHPSGQVTAAVMENMLCKKE